MCARDWAEGISVSLLFLPQALVLFSEARSETLVLGEVYYEAGDSGTKDTGVREQRVRLEPVLQTGQDCQICSRTCKGPSATWSRSSLGDGQCGHGNVPWWCGRGQMLPKEKLFRNFSWVLLGVSDSGSRYL